MGKLETLETIPNINTSTNTNHNVGKHLNSAYKHSLDNIQQRLFKY
jgi:hypothetical protein